ncbi:RDD family protein [Nonomuraea sp. NPDC049419]|uniref:RDD family protein n=1 Tax=Nonomuraea sp. NPDC049419 TaxID=3155772 RepID=UPI00341A1074
MSDERRTIDDYTDKVARHLIGAERDRARAELGDHLSEAAEAGELTEALDRLGPPAEAAAAFAESRTAQPARIDLRFVAVLIDNLPLVAISIALFVQGVLRTIETGAGFTMSFPPATYFRIGEGCVAFTPLNCGAYDASGLIYSLGFPLALAWSVIGLGLLEARTGTTPGKRLMKLRVVTETGLRIHPLTGIVRRISLLLGPFAWVDWVPAVWGDRRRILDRLTTTKVVPADR